MQGTRGKLLCGASIALAAVTLSSGLAYAQEAADSEEAVVVTGTRLRGVAPVGSPIQSITTQDLEEAAETSTARIIQELPQVLDLGISEGSRGQNGGSGNIVYGTGINLRGLGPYATLILIDGHRAVSNNRALDPSVIPALGLQRIEVLADGASAIYGSDAVAGVVNLVPTRFRDGGQVFARYGYGDEYDEYTAGAAWGTTWEDGQLHVAYERSHRSALRGEDRDFFRQNQTAQGGLDYRVAQCDPGNVVMGGVTYPIPDGGADAPGDLIAGSQRLCEGSLNQDLLPEQTYDSFSFTLNQKITPWLELIADGFYSDREFYRAVADSAANLTVPTSNAFYVAPAGVTPGPQTIRYNFANELPSNDTWGGARNYEATIGFGISLPGDWRAEVLGTYGESRDDSYALYGINNGALTAALNSSNPATAFDPYGLHRTSDAVLAGLANQIFFAPTDNEFLGLEARLDGVLFSLPGGDVRLAAGYERQLLEYHAGIARGAPTTQLTWRDFERTVDSYYVEVLVPIFGEGNAVPGLRRLDLNIAGRTDSYSDVGDTTNPKIGINWSPVEDLTIRGSYGTSLRAPTFAELYGNSSNLYSQNYTDPTIGGANRQGVALSGGNLALKPEEATTVTYGFDWAPSFLPGLRLSGTYFDIEYEGQIAAYLSNLNVLSIESEFAGTGIIVRGTDAAAAVANLLGQGITYATPVAGNPITLFVDGRTNNLGRSLMTGVDLEASYSFDIGNSELTAALSATLLDNYETSITPNGTLTDRLDTIFNPHDLRWRSSLRWEIGNFHAFGVVNYVGAYTNNLLATPREVDAWVTADINLGYDLGGEEGVTLGLDVRNLTDEDPPYVNVAPNANGSGGYDASAANPTGRVIGVSIRKRF